MNENERPLSGWTTDELQNEIKRLESRVDSFPIDDTPSVLEVLHEEFRLVDLLSCLRSIR